MLEIFDLYRKDHYNNPRPLPVWKWHILVHVCKRWRQLVFSSPHRLDLKLLCTYGTPFRENLGIWPAFPIVLDLHSPGSLFTPNDEDNAIAALEHSDRLCSINLYVTGSMRAKMSTVLSKPFPLLKRFKFYTVGLNVPALPDEFLGGSAPCLQEFYLNGIPFPALPTLLLTTSNLVNLTLSTIPPTGYIPPEAMVACLDVLPSSKALSLNSVRLIHAQVKSARHPQLGACFLLSPHFASKIHSSILRTSSPKSMVLN